MIEHMAKRIVAFNNLQSFLSPAPPALLLLLQREIVTGTLKVRV